MAKALTKQQAQHEADRAELKQRNAAIEPIIKPLRDATYGVDFGFREIERTLFQMFEKDYGGVNLAPDFQRGHVWSESQQAHYIENILRGHVRPEDIVIKFNIPHFNNFSGYSGDLPREAQIIDGLQRLTAIIKFVHGDLRLFDGQIGLSELQNTSWDPRRVAYRIRLQVFDFQTKAELLQYYLDVNAGGTPHTQEELNRVREMLSSLPAHETPKASEEV